MANKHAITPADIIPAHEYAAVRAEWRRKMSALKRHRRLEVGPFVTFYFESYETMWHQIQEMLHIEGGGAAQLPDELEAYNPQVPKGQNLSATFMIEIDDPDRRKRLLLGLGGIEETAFLEVGGAHIVADPELDQDRTSAEGKASSVQFVHFRLTPAQIAAFKQPGARVLLGLSHPNYSHMAVLPEPMRAALATDFD